MTLPRNAIVSVSYEKVHFTLVVGSILRVTTADAYASGKTSQFLGICIQRSGTGLGATFILRNTIEGQGRFHFIILIFWKMLSQDPFLFSASWDKTSGTRKCKGL